MHDTKTIALRRVMGGELYVWRKPDSRFWKFNFYERYGPPILRVSGLSIPCGRLINHPFKDLKFDSPDAAADALREFFAGDSN